MVQLLSTLRKKQNAQPFRDTLIGTWDEIADNYRDLTYYTGDPYNPKIIVKQPNIISEVRFVV